MMSYKLTDDIRKIKEIYPLMEDMELSNHMFYHLKNYLIFSGSINIDNFLVPIKYVTLL